MKTRAASRRCFIASSVLALGLLLPSWSWACGPYSDLAQDLDTLSFIEPTIAAAPGLRVFFYHFSEPYGMAPPEAGRPSPNEDIFDLDSANLKEWREYLAKTFSVTLGDAELGNLVNKEENLELLKECLDLIRRKGSKQDGPCKKMDAATIEYLIYARNVNSAINSQGVYALGQWELSFQKEGRSKLNDLFDAAQKRAFARSLHPFLQERYGFQAVRLATLGGEFGQADGVFRRVFGEGKCRSLSCFRALGYGARALYKTQSKAQALRAYVQLFDQSPPLMNSAISSVKFMFDNTQEMSSVLPKLGSDRERISAIFIRSLLERRDFSQETLSRMVELGPDDPKTEAVLVRTLQLIEKEFMPYFPLLFAANLDEISPQSEWPESAKVPLARLLDKNKFQGLVRVCETAALHKKAKTPALWLLAGVYLSLLDRDIPKAEALFHQATQLQDPSDVVRQQLHLMGTLMELQKTKSGFNPEIQERLVLDLGWAASLNSWENNNGLYHSLWVLAGQRFLAAGDLPRAGLCFAAAKGPYGIRSNDGYWSQGFEHGTVANYLLDALESDAELELLQGLLEGNGREPLMDLAAQKIDLRADDVVYLRALRLLRRDQPQLAQPLFDRLPAEFWKEERKRKQSDEQELGYFGQSRVLLHKTITCADQNPETDKNVQWKKLQIKDFNQLLFKMLLQRQAVVNKDPVLLARINFSLGNLYYSLALSGFPIVWGLPDFSEKRDFPLWRHGFFYTYREEMYDVFPFAIPGVIENLKIRHKKYIAQEWDNFKKAAHYYQKVLDSKADVELAAKSCLLLNITQNGWIYKGIEQEPEKMNRHQYLYTFNKEFGKTSFHQEIIKECPLLEKFR